MDGIKRVKVGKHVDIKRSDGRIHSAMISAICIESNTVTVEWMENGETKGKEIDFDQLIGLNPTLIHSVSDGSPPPIPSEIDRTSPNIKLANGKPPMDTEMRPKRRQTTSIPVLPALPLKGASTNVVKVTNGRAVIDRRMKPLNENFDDDDPEAMSMKPPSPQPDKPRSQTVQEIEKLKKGREERRAKMEEARQQQRQDLAAIEPGNPNWEFVRMIHEYRSKLDYHRMWAADGVEDHKISVCVRKRPLSSNELDKREIDVITVPNSNHMIVHQPQTKVDLTKFVENQTFRFDYSFDETATNELVYKFSAQPLVRTVFEKGFATCFAYGQTGSGKTHTMGGADPMPVSNAQGKSRTNAAMNKAAVEGIYAMAARDVFRLRDQPQFSRDLRVSCSFFEIYGSNVFDLLGEKRKLRVLEDGRQQVQVVGLREAPVENERQVLELIRRGGEVRTAGKTSVNERSSRSHAVFQIVLRQKLTSALHGKFSLVDLAGNERGADTGSSDRQTRMEGAEINKSLLALKECIRALGRKNAHLPFRASKLTLVLRDSFIGDNARTCMIAMISPGLSSCENSLNTLRYANRVKELGVGGGVDVDVAQLSDDPDLDNDGSDDAAGDSDASPPDPEPPSPPLALLDAFRATIDDAARSGDVLSRARRGADFETMHGWLRRLRDVADDQADRWASLAVDFDQYFTTMAAPSAATTNNNNQRNNNKGGAKALAAKRY